MAAEHNGRIVVAGAGSVGCYAGGCLALAGRDVTLLMRPALAEAIARHGLRVTDLGGSDRLLAPTGVRLATDAERALAEADVVLVAVKSGDTGAMAGLIGEHAPSGVTVVSLQNGVGNADALLQRLGGMARVVAGMVPFNVVQTRPPEAPPRFHRATSGTLLIGTGVAGLRATLDVPGLAVAENRDMTSVLWAKLLLNLNNALNALAGVPLATELADKRWRRLLAQQIDEGLAVLSAAGIRPARIEGVPPAALPRILRLPDWLFRRVAGSMLAIDPEARSSMWEDLEQRRPTEIGHLQGALLELAAKLGWRMPVTETVARLVRAAEAAKAGSPGLTPEQIRA